MRGLRDRRRNHRLASLDHSQKLEKAKPVLKKLPGWKCDITGIREFDKLPAEAQNYVNEIEKLIGFPITYVSNGPGREDIIKRTPQL